MFDLDIRRFQVTKHVRLASNKVPVPEVKITLVVKNTSTEPGEGSAIIQGYQGENLVGFWDIPLIKDDVGNGQTRQTETITLDEPSVGPIFWEARLEDGNDDPDDVEDYATATTTVVE